MQNYDVPNFINNNDTPRYVLKTTTYNIQCIAFLVVQASKYQSTTNEHDTDPTDSTENLLIISKSIQHTKTLFLKNEPSTDIG